MSINVKERKSVTSGFWTVFALFSLSLLLLNVVYLFRVTLAEPTPYDLGGWDAMEYHNLARYVRQNFDFSNKIFSLRPPGLPVYMALIYELVGSHFTIVVYYNLVLAALTVVMTYKLTRLLVDSQAVATIAAILLALDLATLDAGVTLMTEPVHNFLLVLGLTFFVRLVKTGRWRYLFIVAAAVIAALMIRPISVYFPLLLALILLAFAPRRWLQPAVLVALCVVPYVAWSFRNLHYRDSFSYSTSGPFTALFYKAVSVESHATGRDPFDVSVDVALEVEHRMGNTNVTREDVQDFAVGRDADRFTTNAEREKLISQMAMERFREYPAWFAIMTGVSFARQFIPTEMPLPGWLQWMQVGLYVLLGLAGMWAAWLKRNWLLMVLGAGVLLYYLALPSLSHAGLYTSRYRTAWVPVGVIFSAVGVWHIWQKLKSDDTIPAS